MRNTNFWQLFNIEKEMFVFGVSKCLKVMISTIEAVSLE